MYKRQRNDDALTADEVAGLLQVSRSSVYKLVKADELASYHVGRKIDVYKRQYSPCRWSHHGPPQVLRPCLTGHPAPPRRLPFPLPAGMPPAYFPARKPTRLCGPKPVSSYSVYPPIHDYHSLSRLYSPMALLICCAISDAASSGLVPLLSMFSISVSTTCLASGNTLSRAPADCGVES